ncbi:MAG: hypothetical protein IJL75_01155, partial [Eubacterium sp.]|nr:hypothetical protein [Eubacterium sp.]
RKTLRRPIAIGMALVLAAAVVPKYTPVAYAATGYVIKEDASNNDVILDKGTGEIVSAHSAISFGADNGHTFSLKAGNVTAATEDPESFGTTDYAFRGGVGRTGKAILNLGDITVPKGQIFYMDVNTDSSFNLTAGNAKGKDGFNLTCQDKGTSKIKMGNIETDTANHLASFVYYGANGGAIDAELGDVTVAKGVALSLSAARSNGSIKVKAGKLTGNEHALSLNAYDKGKTVAETKDLTANRGNGIYISDGDGDVDVTVNGNVSSNESRALVIGHGGLYKIIGDVNAPNSDGISCGSNKYSDENIVITGTVNAGAHAVNGRLINDGSYKNLSLTVWKLVWGDGYKAFEGDDENGTFAKSVNYIVKKKGKFSLTKENGSALDKSYGYEVAHEGDRLYLTADSPINYAYTGSGDDIVELPKDDAGNYYYDVTLGGGIEIFAAVEGDDDPEIKPEPTPEPTPDTPVVSKKKNPMTVTARRIYGKKKKNVTISKTRAFTIKKAKGTVTFKRVSRSSHKLQIDKKTGKITIKKGLKKDKNYFMVVEVKAAGNKTYKSKKVKVELRIRIK